MNKPDWQLQGSEPDYRFSLANERTFLAWIRTALAILAGGVALHQFGIHVAPRGVVVPVAVGLSLLSSALAGGAYFRWKRNEQAMRQGTPLPATIGIPALSLAISFVALLLRGLAQ